MKDYKEENKERLEKLQLTEEEEGKLTEEEKKELETKRNEEKIN